MRLLAGRCVTPSSAWERDGAAGGSSDKDRRDAALADYFGTRHSRYRERVRVYQ